MAVMTGFQVSELLLLSGNGIPFAAAGVTIHQPKLKEIALIGEKAFFAGCELLRFTKDILVDQDKSHLSDQSDFEILMMILNDENPQLRESVQSALLLLTIIFPGYEVFISPEKIILKEQQLTHFIDVTNFESFKKILSQMFCSYKFSKHKENEFNPQGELARQIAEKLKRGRQRVAAAKASQNSGDKKVAILSRYVSILSVGEAKDMNSLMNYTVPQLIDEFDRYQLKLAYDMNIKSRLAGASNMKEPEDWMKDLYDDTNQSKG